jgi:hypothetical protein
MTPARILRASILGSFVLLQSFGMTAIAASPTACTEPKGGTKDAPMLSPPLSMVVTGTGRLQFYLAPNSSCAMKGVFVIPKDELIAYAQTANGWSSVMYVNPRTGNDVQGWVRSSRLKETGTIAPRQ